MAKRKSSGSSNALAGAIAPVETHRVSAKEKAEFVERERRYRAQSALETLQRADEIRQDKALMRDVKGHAREQIKTLSKIK